MHKEHINKMNKIMTIHAVPLKAVRFQMFSFLLWHTSQMTDLK